MRNISFNQLKSIDFSIKNIYAVTCTWPNQCITRYNTKGRIKNLLHYLIDGRREYYIDDKYLLDLNKSEIIFIPNGYHYSSKVAMDKRDATSTGIGISFDLYDENGEELFIDEGLKKFYDEKNENYLRLFQQIQDSVISMDIGKVHAKACLYRFFDEVTSNIAKDEYQKKCYNDIVSAIKQIERYPEKNIPINELAQLCCLCESSFRLKFKQYSNGVSPLDYRNRIRIMKAEELCMNSFCTIETAAQILGFCDAAHLCKVYKKYTGKTLKK